MLRAAKAMDDPIIKIEYEFKLLNGERKEFSIRLQRRTLQLVAENTTTVRHWTKLTHHQCTNCPLKPEKHYHCPIAANMVDVIESFKDSLSIEEADITIRSESREYHKRSTVQYGIGALIGLYMVTSGCPIMDKLRPMFSRIFLFHRLKKRCFARLRCICSRNTLWRKMEKGPIGNWKISPKFTKTSRK